MPVEVKHLLRFLRDRMDTPDVPAHSTPGLKDPETGIRWTVGGSTGDTVYLDGVDYEGKKQGFRVQIVAERSG